MIPVKHSRRITVRTDKIIPIVTESKGKKEVLLTDAKGNKLTLKAHQLTKEMIKFLEQTYSIEYLESTEGRRGLSEIAGIKVQITPINHTNYDGGAYIKVTEEDEMATENTNKVLAYLRKRGIDTTPKTCTYTDKELTCMS